MNGKNIVRRLTPTECLRLQGFPDKWLDTGDWTDEKERFVTNLIPPNTRPLGTVLRCRSGHILQEESVLSMSGP